MTIGTLRFTLRDQQAFARLSGDHNPVHLDPAAARRVAAGEPIVHGMHLVLSALDLHFKDRRTARRWTVSATFRRPALVGDSIRVERRAGGRLALTIDGGAPLVEITIAAAGGESVPAAWAGAIRRTDGGAIRKPRVRTSAGLAGAQGARKIPAEAAIRRAFPNAVRGMGADAVAALAAVSPLVGMECPGRDSLLSAIHLELTARVPDPHLSWRVTHVDARFGRVRIEVGSNGASGTVDAFLRPTPVSPPEIESVAAHVNPNEFVGQRALIVGGSRGLGAATALIVASGGGVPLVTYAAGSLEVAALRRDARRAGKRIEALRFNLTADPIGRLARAAFRFRATHLYYFASPRIFARRREPFDGELFQRFAAFYVTGFASVCAAASAGSSPLHVFYPSSVAVDECPHELAEYCAAKAAGETLARVLQSAMPTLRILVRRLPRIATDQTASIIPARALDPVTAMLPIVREMERAAGALR